MAFRIVPVEGESWRLFRDLRLEMLADSPKAFVETLDAALQQSDDDWLRRAVDTNSESSCGFAAVDDAGRWVGIMRARVEDGRTFLLGVYVTPLLRGEHLADALLLEIERWAGERGHDQLTLEVHEHNERAQAFYRRRGFSATGDRVLYPLAPHEQEIVMTKPLAVR
ncbi:GNAT family N-acetyltransferase [Rhodococcoides yunnanense]|uniref:GNAT family N-acetyltransferase n=1 Tax=Rhodococcoides yunnanense TaxID=278209 RepID=A0ABU4B848_9NOCA|nr:GNAT family N-acetyltransferase [Rhodococcus yunnanensis]MDV6260357.1 GNAT family N-acetyltransferase [Rhodococcus yunnanensis]